MATLLGIDYGHKKIGFAVGQTITQTSMPLSVVMHNGQMWSEIEGILEQWRPKIIIIGEPLLADGTQHPLEKKIEKFMKDLKKIYNAEIYRENEALTSYEASCFFEDKNKAVDAYAAAILLESWMRGNTISE